MHELLDQHMVDTINRTGNTYERMPDRATILEAHGLPYDRPAENVIITGCQMLGAIPQVLLSLSRVLDRAAVSHTFLSLEYCCGNNLYRAAIKAHNDEALEECRSLSKQFVRRNVDAAAKLGARRLTVFCSPCYPIYKHACPDADIAFYPVLLEETMHDKVLYQTVDYYSGCYRLHKEFAPEDMDLESADNILEKIEGLEVNRIAASTCCYDPDGLAHMLDNTRNRLLVHVCTGCYLQALLNMPPDKAVKVVMLPELVEMAGSGLQV